MLLDLVFIQILSTVIALLCLTLAFFFVAGGADFLDMDGPLGFVGIFYFIANFLLLNGYFIYFELWHRSATWGKRLVGIRVASRDGSRRPPRVTRMARASVGKHSARQRPTRRLDWNPSRR